MTAQESGAVVKLTAEVLTMANSAPKLLMDKKEAARWIGIGVDTLDKAVNAGLISPRKLLPSDTRANWFSVIDCVRMVESMEKG